MDGVVNLSRNDFFKYLIFGGGGSESRSELESETLPYAFTSNSYKLRNYRIYGNTVDGESVGDLVTEGEHSGEYLVPVTVEGKNLFDCKTERIPSLTTNITSMSVNETLQAISITANNTDARIGKVVEVGANYADNLGYKYPCEAGKYYYLSDSNDVFDKNYITFFNDDNISLGYSLVATTAIQAPNNATYFTIRFGIANSVSGQTYTGKLMITELSTFEPPSIYEPYQTPVTTNLYLPEQIKMVGDEAEYVDYKEQEQYFADGTSTAVTLPALPTLSGTNTLSVGTTVQPSKIYLQGNIETVSEQSLQASPRTLELQPLSLDVMPIDRDEFQINGISEMSVEEIPKTENLETTGDEENAE